MRGEMAVQVGEGATGVSVSVTEVTTAKDLRAFIRLPWRLYRGDPNWVPPLISDLKATLAGPDNANFNAGPHALALARRTGAGAGVGTSGAPASEASREPVGRIVVGMNEALNRVKDAGVGYISLFESVNDYEVARALFDWAAAWLRARGANLVKGPISPTNGDDYRGLLVMGFCGRPVLMDSYNPPHYQDFFERYGFSKDIDLFAYLYREELMSDRYERAASYAMRRYGFRVDSLNLKELDRDIRDIKSILDRAMPEEWEDMTPPTLEDLRGMGRRLRSLADPDLCPIARVDGTDEPIAFVIGLPDYNQVLARLNGRLSPLGLLKFLWYRRRIDGVRLFVLFVVPEWRKKGVTGAIFLHALREGRRKGYKWGEGSTVGETNLPMRRDAERAGGEHYRTYRIYRKDL